MNTNFKIVARAGHPRARVLCASIEGKTVENIYIETLEGDEICVLERVPAHLISFALDAIKNNYPDARGVWCDIPHSERAFHEAAGTYAYDMGDDIIDDNGEGFPDDDDDGDELDRRTERAEYDYNSGEY